MTRKEAIAAHERFRGGLRELSAAKVVPTVGSVWEAWLADRADDGLSNEIYRHNWKALAPTFAHLLPSSITKKVCKDYARARFDKGIAAWTVWTELSRLRACLKWAAGAGQVLDKPVPVWVPPKGKARNATIDLEDFRRLLEGSKAGRPYMEVFTVLVLTTAARHRAILDLEWDRVDFVANMIHFDDEPIRDPLSRAWRKGRASVPMNALSRAVLLRAFHGRTCNFVVEHGGKRLKYVGDGFANVVQRAGLVGKITPHTIRHSVATILDELGHDERRIQELLGHKPGSKVTRSTYTHADPAKVLQGAVTVLDIPKDKGT